MPEAEVETLAEEPPLVDDPSNPDSEVSEEDDDDDDDDETSSTLLYGALHGLEPLEPGAEPRQRIGTSKCGISKKSWTKAEDAILTEIVQRNGAQRWSNVASQLPGRAGKQCRERCALCPWRMAMSAYLGPRQRPAASRHCTSRGTGGSIISAQRSKRARGPRRRIASSWNRSHATALAGQRL